MNKKMLIAVFAFLLVVRLYPAVVNEYPKGSDSWYHLYRAHSLVEGNLLEDSLNAGGAVSSYPPVFHVVIMPVFFFEPLQAAKFLAVAISFLALIAFFLFARKLFGENAAIAATFVFGAAVEIVNTAIFLSGEPWFPAHVPVLVLLAVGQEKTVFLSSVLLALTHTMTFFVFILFYAVLARKHLKFLVPSIVAFIAWMAITKASGAASMIIPGTPMTVAQYFYGFSPMFFALAFAGISSKNKRLALLFFALTAYSFLAGLYPERIFTFSIIPAALLAGMALEKYWKSYEEGLIRLALILAIVVAAFFVLDYSYARAELTNEDKAVLDWAKINTPQNSVIASSWQVSGSWMPLLAERSNVLGAFQESVIDYGERRKDLDIIFTSEDKVKIENAMKKYNATHIFVNQLEGDYIYKGSIKRLSSMFREVKGNGYAHLFEI